MRDIVEDLKTSADWAVAAVFVSVLVGIQIPSSIVSTVISTQVGGSDCSIFSAVEEATAQICLRVIPPWRR